MCNGFFFVFSLLSIFYFIAFHSRPDRPISAGNSLSVPQYSVVPLFILMFDLSL